MRRPFLAARRALVVAPHPDDEVIGAWALMCRLRRSGAQVRVLVVSDGGASHPRSRAWPRERLVRERRRETLRALAMLSIRPSQVRFLAMPDGALEQQPASVAAAIGRALRRGPAPELIVGPVSGDAHGDHRAVARALARLPRRGERRLGYRIWPMQPGHEGCGTACGLDQRSMAAKRRAIRSYRTQTGRITDAEAGFTMTSRHLNAFVRPTERFTVLG